MEILVLDTDFTPVTVLDVFESSIWTDRYCGYGDFEIYTKMTEKAFNALRQDYYLWMNGSEHIMIIESCQIKFDVENGNYLIVTGRSYESVLDRRIVWTQTILKGNLQNGIQLLLNENAISPSDPNRVIPNLIFEASVDPLITSLTVDAQFTRTELYETIKSLCATNGIGFKISLSDTTNKLVFKLYAGTNRSQDQLVHPYVIFSPSFENIINSNYVESKKDFKNLTVVAGEGEGVDRKTTVIGNAVALARREMYTDARDLSQTVDGVLIPELEYLAQLAQRGYEDLVEHLPTQSFEGQVDTTRMFVYGTDFFMGDIVQIVSEYGIGSKARITEIISSQSESGVEVYPTFEMIE